MLAPCLTQPEFQDSKHTADFFVRHTHWSLVLFICDGKVRPAISAPLQTTRNLESYHHFCGDFVLDRQRTQRKSCHRALPLERDTLPDGLACCDAPARARLSGRCDDIRGRLCRRPIICWTRTPATMVCPMPSSGCVVGDNHNWFSHPSYALRDK
jgi:hypothetical protein